ncbi:MULTISPECIES: hypothetical protein [Kitasatospora]|uniref:Uncharacterized protein n=1 Tax=Kitasatospora setae (strain ATCC 33774 / DSM 43861 / JCM 3304 / KCC A-0304 / NBRC 14216 / KM-6054) TaxID=452652 RepID=E4NB15_KITSK|nr:MULTISPECIES: hypothetical protein [Kitasatospora]BAJ28396.1 hypothetical protein KSE_25830 [Kitasatospora setae KM-6054]
MWWGVGGALAASAVWAVTVLTVPPLVRDGLAKPPAPSSAGYRAEDDLCATAALPALGRLYPSPSGSPYHYTTRHRVTDEMYCSQYRKKAATDSDHYSLYLQVQLHHQVDPAPEFGAQREGLAQRRYLISPVDALGDEAYLGYLDDPGRSDPSWHYLTQVLYVRQGGMTCYASWSGSYQDGKATAPDLDQVRAALLSDTRDLLHALGGSPT